MNDERGNTLPEATMAPQLRVLDGIAGWCGGLHGSMPLQDAVSSLAYGFGSECAVLSRQFKSEVQARTVAIFDHYQDHADYVRLGRSLASDVMGSFFTQARGTTIWFLSDHQDDPDWKSTNTLAHWQVSREVREVVVMVLASNQQQADYLEFHFTRQLARSEKLEFESLVPTIVRSWTGRQTGLVTQTRMNDRLVRARDIAQVDKMRWTTPILGMSNPARLSRAEFRVCLLLSRGLSV
ncbi:hypothetical protein N9L47_13800, partial [Rhodobacteraceae bacterium]|nr:hypothetical protein [Paracoccaceae bacterium]